MSVQLVLVNPPARKGFTHERAQSGGVGVARKLKLLEKSSPEVLPHDFLYQAAVAERDGHHVQLVDLPLEEVYDIGPGVEFTRVVIGRRPAERLWIGVRFSMPTLRLDIAFANALKAAFPDARVYAFGNVLMTTHRHWIGEAHFDYVFYGEPEAIISEALAAEDSATVPGVIDVATYTPPEGLDLYSISSTADYRRWRKVLDLSSLPRAAWHLLELQRYAPHGRVSDMGVSVPASRGCFMPCTMCAYSLLEGRQLRFREPDDVLDELEYLYRAYGIRLIRFRDANFSANKQHLEAIAQGIIDRGLPIEASAELSLELLERHQMELLWRAGIRTILTGVESNDAEVMRSLGQNVKISHILREKIAIATEVGLKVYTFFLIGAPEETWETIGATIAFARSLGTESTMTIMTPFPGTAMYWRALYEGLLVHGRQMRYEDWNSYTATMRTYAMSPQEITIARTWARLETYTPYLWNHLRHGPAQDRLEVLAQLAPRVASLLVLRAYAAWRASRKGAVPGKRSSRVEVAAGSGLIPIPVLRQAE